MLPQCLKPVANAVKLLRDQGLPQNLLDNVFQSLIL